MPAFRVSIHGRNFLVSVDGRLRKLGFYTWRDVDAADPEAAEAAAIQLIREAEYLRDVAHNSPGDSPMLFVEEIRDIESVNPARSRGGLAWYDEDGADEDSV